MYIIIIYYLVIKIKVLISFYKSIPIQSETVKKNRWKKRTNPICVRWISAWNAADVYLLFDVKIQTLKHKKDSALFPENVSVFSGLFPVFFSGLIPESFREKDGKR